MAEEENYISLYQLSKKIESALKDPDLIFKWVTFEIKSISVNQSNGHCYLEVIEKSDNGVTIASAKGTIWRSTYSRIWNKFLKSTGTELQRGMKVLALVSVSYHTLYGISINITDIDPSFTLGESERIRRETIEKLHADGIWDMNGMCPLPMVVQRIAVVSSPTAAGYGDFCHQIEHSGLNIRLSLFESLMQGNQAEQSIIKSLEIISGRADEFDAIVIIRGGGASGDLDCFDGYMVCSAIAQMPLPVLTGIGHNRDVSIADMVAAIPLKTPTAVATWIIDRASEYLLTMEKITTEIQNRAQNIILGLWNQYEINCKLLRHGAEGIISSKSLQLTESHSRLNRITSTISVREQSKISRREENLKQGTDRLFSLKKSSIALAEQGIRMRWKNVNDSCIANIKARSERLQSLTLSKCQTAKSSIDRFTIEIQGCTKRICDKEDFKIASCRERLRMHADNVLKYNRDKNNNMEQLLLSHNPKNVLKKGYAIIRKKGAIISQADRLSEGDDIEILLRDGNVLSEVKKINYK